MKLLQLNIHNIASIEDAIIDFSQGPLAATELFLITGKTGSGKSTILDAICLALYANTPRMSNQNREVETIGSDNLSLNSPLQLLRKNTGEGFVSLLFEGNNDVRYKATWAVRRARNQVNGTIQNKIWTLENLSNNITLTKDAEIKAEIQIAVGLDFSQFCRTTLLAQGEFTKFLNSNDDDKADILEKITGVDIYTKIGQKIYSKYTDIKSQYEQLQSQAGDVPLLTTEEERQLTTQLQDLNTESQHQQQIADTANLALGHYDAMAKATEEMKQQQATISNLQQEYSHILAGVGHIHQQINMTSKQIDDLERLLLAEATKAPVYQEQPAIATHIITILTNTRNRTQHLSNQNLKEQELTPKNKELIAAQNDQKLATDALQDHLEAQQVLVKQLEEAALTDKRHLAQARNREKNTAEQLYKDILALEGIYDQVNQKHLRLRTIEQELDQLTKDKKQKTIDKTQADTILQKAELKKQVWADTIDEWAKTMRQKLQVGDICPVCRQQVTHIEVESQLDQNYQNAVKEYNTAKKSADDLTSKMAQIEALIQSTRKEETNKQNEIKAQEEEIAKLHAHCKSQCESYQISYSDNIVTTKTHIQEYINRADTEIQALNTAIAIGEKIEQQLQDSNKQRNVLQLDKENKEKLVNDIHARIATIQTEIIMLKTKAQACTQNLDTANAAIHQLIQHTTWQYDWHTEPEAFAQELKDASERYKQDNNTLTQAQQYKQLCENKLSSIQTQINKLLEIKPEWQQIVTTDQTNIPEIQNLVNQLVANVQTALQRYADAVSNKVNAEREYNTYIALHPIDKLTPVLPQLKERIQQAKAKKEQLHQDIGRIRAKLVQNTENRAKITSLREQMQQLEGPKAMWHKLCNTLALGNSDGKYFRKIAQSYVLNSLVNAANRYLAMLTNSRYRLTITLGSFLILIEDACQAFSKRSTGTISGGESFLVSLSLALALSDIGTLSVDTLFIDEGFGSLSGEALDNAINTLYSLHHTCGRKVGIISHIEDLRERIPVKIQVEQETNLSSSKITVIS